MSHRNGHPMEGSARARWMADVKDLINMQRLNDTVTEAAARRVYGDDFKAREPEDTQLAGGDIKYEVHNHLPVTPTAPIGRRWPKSTGLILATAVLSAAVVVAAWLVSGRPVPVPAPAPPSIPSAPAKGGDHIEFYKP